VRALASRTGRRALAAFIGDQDDEALEQRFAQPRRQRALLRGMVRGFQPAYAAGFQGVVAYEIEPFAIAPPPDAPWRWAIEVDARNGRARLVEPAPLDAAVTIYFGLADWRDGRGPLQHRRRRACRSATREHVRRCLAFASVVKGGDGRRSSPRSAIAVFASNGS
jgi:hypothetical protein